MEIIDLVHYDVCLVLNEMKKQQILGISKAYFINSDRKIINVDEFIKYIQLNHIANLFVIKDILTKAYEIIELYNNVFPKIEAKEAEYRKQDLSRGGVCFKIRGKEKWDITNTKDAYDIFFNDEKTRPYHNQRFVQECSKLINYITAAFPELKLAERKLESIFNEKNNSFEVCIDALEYLEITIAGVPNITKGRVGKLTGLITAIKETPGMLKLESATDNQLLNYFNSHLNTKFTTFSKRNQDYKPSLDDAKRFIKNNFKK